MMTKDALEPIVAFGARMSWVGALRPGNEFAPPQVSRRGVMTSSSDAPLQRHLGLWSEQKRCFLASLTSPWLSVRLLEADEEVDEGVQCVVHWVERRALLHTGPHSVCRGDGWPPRLWESLLSVMGDETGLAEALRAVLWSTPAAHETPSVSRWRATLVENAPAFEVGATGWLPMATELVTPTHRGACFLSYAPGTPFVASLTEAIEASDAAGHVVDRHAQAIYYLECTLATLHGVRFGADDFVDDPLFESGPEVSALYEQYHHLEQSYLDRPDFGSFARRGQL